MVKKGRFVADGQAAIISLSVRFLRILLWENRTHFVELYYVFFCWKTFCKEFFENVNASGYEYFFLWCRTKESLLRWLSHMKVAGTSELIYLHMIDGRYKRESGAHINHSLIKSLSKGENRENHKNRKCWDELLRVMCKEIRFVTM